MNAPTIALSAPSLLDRLLDATPELSADPPRTRQAQVRDALDSIRRDLEALLNTRRLHVTPPPALTQLRQSLLSYGMADFIGANMVTREQRQAFAAKIEESIRIFEPRFRNLSVTVLDPRDTTARVLRLRIEATVVLQEGPLPVLFASSVSPTTLRFSVSEASHV
jgi:type VI secretion system protein ImpF